jgi:hypothetical protein
MTEYEFGNNTESIAGYQGYNGYIGTGRYVLEDHARCKGDSCWVASNLA